MVINTYDIGDNIRLKAIFSVSGVATDPSTITLKVKNAAGVTTTYTYALAEITKSSTGIYYRDVSVDDDGMWYYRWEGTGTVETSEEHSFKVRSSEF